MKKQVHKTRILNAKILTLCAVLGGVLQGFSQPTTVQPAPTAPAGHVISLYTSSQTYNDITGNNFYEIWWGGQMTFGGGYTVAPLTNVVQYYQNLYFDGVGFESNPQDVSGCTNLHVDVFTPNGDHFAVRMVDTTGHSADVTFTTNAPAAITAGGWIGLDLPLSQFTAAQPLLNLHSIQQLGWIINSTPGVQPADYYIDNVYFVGSSNLVFIPPPPIPVPTNAAPVPTRPASSVVAMYDSSSTYALWPGSGGVNWHAGWSGSGESSVTITNTSSMVMYLPALSYVGVEFYDPNRVDASATTTLHFDLWSPNANQIGVTLVSTAGANGNQGAEVKILASAGVVTTNRWVSMDIPLSAWKALNPLIDFSSLDQLLWIDNGDLAGPGLQGADYYIDNVYFWNTNQVDSSIAAGAQVSWTASNGSHSYQPQKSGDNTAWSNLGALIAGNAITSQFDAVKSPFYRVLDISAAVANVAINPSFEIPAGNNSGAANWTSGANDQYDSVWATNHWGAITPHDGTNLLYMEGTTAAASPAAPNTYLQSDQFPVIAGVPYAVSFYAANPVQVGGANPQYRVRFYDASHGFLTEQWNSFASAGNTWTRFSQTNTAPANAAYMEFFFIQAIGAGASWDWVTLIDDIKVSDSTAAATATTNVLSTVVQPAVGVTWKSGTGLTYTVQSSPALTSGAWSPLGANVIGTGTNMVSDPATATKKFYRVLEDY